MWAAADDIASSPWAQIGGFAAIVGAVAVGAWQAFRANRAVNHRPRGEPSIYEKVSQIETILVDRLDRLEAEVGRTTEHDAEFDRKGWTSLDPDLATAPALTSTIRAIQARQTATDERIGRSEERLTRIEASSRRIEEAVAANRQSHEALRRSQEAIEQSMAALVRHATAWDGTERRHRQHPPEENQR